jgi:hypothetical protein
MLSKKTIIGFIVGSIIIALGGYSLISQLGPTVIINENFVVDVGDPISFTIPAPKNAAQHIKILGDSFDLELKSPSNGLQIPKKSYKDEIVLDWVHLEDGESKIKIQNTGSSELEITALTEQTPTQIGFTFDIMVMTSGMVIIGFSMGFTLRKPKGF